MFQKDGANVNGAACVGLSGSFPNAAELCCLSHAIDLIGKRMSGSVLLKIQGCFNQMMATSGAAEHSWKALTGKAPMTEQRVRWWTRLNSLLHNFGPDGHAEMLPAFIDRLDGEACKQLGATITGLLDAAIDAGDQTVMGLDVFRVQLAAYLDFGLPLAKATYALEGDGFISPIAWSIMQEVEDHISLFEGRLERR